MPPSNEPNAIGIRRLDGELSVLRARKKATGISMVRAPMFFTKAESTATAPASTATCSVVVVRWGAMRWKASSTTPERSTAALTRSAEATMMTMSSEKPENALSDGTMPVAIAASSASNATRS